MPDPFVESQCTAPTEGYACQACIDKFNTGIAWQRKVTDALTDSFLPPRLPDMTFGRAGVDYDSTNAPKVARLSRWTRSDGNLWICGTPGAGKTHAAVCVAKRALLGGFAAGLVSARQVVKAGDQFDEAKTAMNRWQHVPVLVLDDFDKITVNERSLSTLWEFMNERVQYGVLTIVTSNPSPAAICKEWESMVNNGSLVTATMDRMQPCTTFQLVGRSLRGSLPQSA